MTHLPVDAFRMLISFHYFKKADVKALSEYCTINGVQPDLFADSGAYSAWSQGAEINISDYADWINVNKKYLGVYCNLDVVDNAEETEANQTILENQGLSPLPVWHIRSAKKVFEGLCEKYNYIAIGGMVGTPWKKLMPSLIWAFKHSIEKNVVLHGLGLTAIFPVHNTPFFSVDSSSFGAGFRFGRCPVWDIEQNKRVGVDLGNKKQVVERRKAIANLGYDPKRFLNRDVTRQELAGIAGLSAALEEQHVRKKIGPVALQERNGHKPYTNFNSNVGVKIFLADGTVPNLTATCDGLRNYKDGK